MRDDHAEAPAQLWGLWVVTPAQPEGFWLDVNGPAVMTRQPMTFLSRDDALRAAILYEDEYVVEGRWDERGYPPSAEELVESVMGASEKIDGGSITVGLIGVTPPDWGGDR